MSNETELTPFEVAVAKRLDGPMYLEFGQNRLIETFKIVANEHRLDAEQVAKGIAFLENCESLNGLSEAMELS